MKGIALTAASVALTATTAIAGGIDRSGQDISILFEEGNHVQLTFATVGPNVKGTSASQPGSNFPNPQWITTPSLWRSKNRSMKI